MRESHAMLLCPEITACFRGEWERNVCIFVIFGVVKGKGKGADGPHHWGKKRGNINIFNDSKQYTYKDVHFIHINVRVKFFTLSTSAYG